MNTYDEVMRNGGMGAVEILGDPAMVVTEADKTVTEWMNRGYKLSDKMWVGIGNGVSLALNAAGPGTPGLVGTVQTQVSNPFKPYHLHFPSEYNADTFLNQLSYGSLQMIDGQPVPNSAFSEASEIGKVSLPTVQAALPIQVQCRNDSVVQIQVAYGIYGIRLRGA